MVVGEIYHVKFFLHKNGLVQGNTAPYPEYDKMWIPVKCLEEYKNFYVMEVQEHQNPVTIFHNKWIPYKITLDKFDFNKEYVIKELI